MLVEAELQVCSDAAGGFGFEVYFQGQWCAHPWPEDWKEKGITCDLTFFKLFPIVMAVHILVPNV